MTGHATHRLDGLEPDNLLAFMALLGLLRALEGVRSDWRPRVSWTVDEPPLRPALSVLETVDETDIAAAAADGVNVLAQRHDFEGLADLTLEPAEATRRLEGAARLDRYSADLWAALVSDAAIARDGKKVERTLLCALGTGQTNFLKTLKSVPLRRTPPKRRHNGKIAEISEYDCLSEALFRAWRRPDRTDGTNKTSAFRWDPHEDVRHAYRWNAPTDDKEPTQHGANRLAAVGLSVLTVVPRQRRGRARLAILGGSRDGDHIFGWPIWREPIGLATIRALLSHPHLDHARTRAALGIVEHRRTRRISLGKYMNFTRAEPVPERVS